MELGSIDSGRRHEKLSEFFSSKERGVGGKFQKLILRQSCCFSDQDRIWRI
jgi:hypothetical protein